MQMPLRGTGWGRANQGRGKCKGLLWTSQQYPAGPQQCPAGRQLIQESDVQKSGRGWGVVGGAVAWLEIYS